jgi:hypothetical protein
MVRHQQLKKYPVVEQDPLTTRDARYGKRTETVRLQYKIPKWKSFQYRDVMSLSLYKQISQVYCVTNCTSCGSLQQLADRTEQVLTRAGVRVEVVASLSQGHTTAAQCGLFTQKFVLVIFVPPCTTKFLNFAEIRGHNSACAWRAPQSRIWLHNARITSSPSGLW